MGRLGVHSGQADTRLLGWALLTCVSTTYIHSEGHYITAAILLDTSHSSAPPPPLPELTSLPGHPGVCEPQSAEGAVVARCTARAWLLTMEETPEGLAVTVRLVEQLKATIDLKHR